MLNAKFFISLSKVLIPRFRKHTFMDALDVNERKFKTYSKKYGEAKRSGQMFRQATEFAKSTAPVLTSDLLRDYKLIKTRMNGFEFGFPTQGGKVENLKKMGRVISTDQKPLPKSLEKFTIDWATKWVQEDLNKRFPNTTIIKVGKKT